MLRGMMLVLAVLGFGVLRLSVLGLGVASRAGTRLFMFGCRAFRGRVLGDCALGGCVFRCRVFRGGVWRHWPFSRPLGWPRAHFRVLRRLRRALLRARLGLPGANMTCGSVVPLRILVR